MISFLKARPDKGEASMLAKLMFDAESNACEINIDTKLCRAVHAANAEWNSWIARVVRGPPRKGCTPKSAHTGRTLVLLFIAACMHARGRALNHVE